MRISYAKQKLHSAVNSMATDTGDIRKRIWHAYLIFHTLSEKDFPDDLKEDWNFIHSNLTTEEPSPDGRIGKVENTLKIMNDKKCIEIAEKITELNGMLSLYK